MNEKEFIDDLIKKLRALKSSIKKKDMLSDKVMEANPLNNTPKQIQKAHTNLNWQCMQIDKEKTNIARTFKDSFLDVDTSEKEYNPSPFHSYKG